MFACISCKFRDNSYNEIPCNKCRMYREWMPREEYDINHDGITTWRNLVK